MRAVMPVAATRAVVSWSAGKDSCFACYLAMQQGYEVTHLVNFISRQFRRVSFHGTRAPLVRAQARAVGIPLVQSAVPPDMSAYEETFKRTVLALRRQGARAMVFGDIYVREHRDWVERICAATGLTPVLPLWGRPPEQVLAELVAAGFEAMVVAARSDILGEDWLGRRVDPGFLADLSELAQGKGLDVCGEYGEYHTLVVDGPLFRERLAVTPGIRVERDGHWFLDLPRWRTVPK